MVRVLASQALCVAVIEMKTISLNVSTRLLVDDTLVAPSAGVDVAVGAVTSCNTDNRAEPTPHVVPLQILCAPADIATGDVSKVAKPAMVRVAELLNVIAVALSPVD